MLLRGWVLPAVMGWSLALGAQQASTPANGAAAAAPQLSPGAAYEQALRPLNIVRDATANWSDAEKNALGVAMQQALRECKARDAKTYEGNDLLAYLQLCTFGWQWEAVQSAAWLYINAKHRVKDDESVWTTPGLGQAYAYEVKSSLSLNDTQEAYFAAAALLREAPYTPLASSATTATIRYLQMIQPLQAQDLAQQRFALMLRLLRERDAAGAAVGSEKAAGAAALVPVPQLYRDALEWLAMMEFDGVSGGTAAEAALEGALPAKMSGDEMILVGEARRRYKLLGAELPKMAITADLGDAKLAAPADFGRSFGAGEVLLVFPDWCSQCVGMGGQFAKTAERLAEKGVRFYAVLAQDGAAPTLPVAAKASVAKTAAGAHAKGAGPKRLPGKAEPDPEQVLKTKTAADELLGTPTLMVSSAALKQLAAEDVPLLVVTDGQGLVRFEQMAPENALEVGSLVDQIAGHVVQQWPAEPAATPAP